MVAVLVTGMSGAGESTALRGLARRGFETVDTDDGDWIEAVDGEPLWRPDRIDRLLAALAPGRWSCRARWRTRAGDTPASPRSSC